MIQDLVDRLKLDYPDLVFTVGSSYCWSPKGNQIFYTIDDELMSVAGILHEIGHARLGHTGFTSDIELLRKEVDAWHEAVQLAEYYRVKIQEEHIQGCLDSYRDWLYKRSHCPRCATAGLQTSSTHYTCINCQTNWQVTGSQLHRPYRLSKKNESF